MTGVVELVTAGRRGLTESGRCEGTATWASCSRWTDTLLDAVTINTGP